MTKKIRKDGTIPAKAGAVELEEKDLDQVQGGGDYKGEIEVLSFSWGASASAIDPQPTGAAGIRGNHSQGE